MLVDCSTMIFDELEEKYYYYYRIIKIISPKEL